MLQNTNSLQTRADEDPVTLPKWQSPGAAQVSRGLMQAVRPREELLRDPGCEAGQEVREAGCGSAVPDRQPRAACQHADGRAHARPCVTPSVRPGKP